MTGAGLLVAALWAAGPVRAAPPLRFELTASATDYRPGDKVELHLSIVLDPSATESVGICTRGVLTVDVTSATRDGRRIRPVRSFIFFEEDPRVFCGHPSAGGALPDALVPLKPGDAVTIPYGVPRLPDDGRAELEEVTFHDLWPHMADTYALTVPGEYTIRLAYRYAGASGGRADVFRGTLFSNPVTFRLVQ